ncbi:DNA-binding transcriptional LysR family regulator [Labrenzia sp. EL_208]|uniref:LysR substrate-binding domain-containing protein n=1 Tax=Roseibium album TaxID=311410 RepID=UPI0018CAB2B3|nr:DNA-binding transcriptional LysR family regulator [Labrenzia sp. EL_195]MBG6175044.1 DNA-binding transcriptional LysR family regulator [Labrenzia sp. EL_132]MBG6229656.1 DNA-binding transcriptional LysR family regulator [Labrenzia sp. EL_208]MCR9058450.1 LysR substrate-binding domain-containing protein [Paracoccaceae bacterium]
MLETKDLRFFSVVAASSSLAAAARALDVTPPAVSQRLAQIETRIGLQLVERGRGRLTLTTIGDALAQRAEIVLDEIENINEEILAHRDRISGPLHVIAPFGFGRAHVAPVLSQLVQDHPDVSLNLTLSDAPYREIASSNWDLLIHVGQLRDSSHIQRKLASNRRFLVASPAYLEKWGTPAHPGDLSSHRCGVVREDLADVTMWSFSEVDGPEHSIRIHPVFASNDGGVIKSWALDDLGIIQRSEWNVAREIGQGQLVQLLPDFRLPNADIVALLSPRTLRTARVDHALKRLVDAYSSPPWNAPASNES